MKHIALAAALLVAPIPAYAQPASAAPPAARAPAPAADPARLALAARVVDALWPLGTYARMMDGTMTEITDAAMAGVLDIPARDMVAAGGMATEDASVELGNRTLREILAEQDPHFAERIRISNRVIAKEIIPFVTALEPRIRATLTSIYARRFSEAELSGINAFFATPAGAAYSRDAMIVFADPEMVTAMATFAPEITRTMPAIMEKVRAATAHLPLPAIRDRPGKSRGAR